MLLDTGSRHRFAAAPKEKATKGGRSLSRMPEPGRGRPTACSHNWSIVAAPGQPPRDVDLPLQAICSVAKHAATQTRRELKYVHRPTQFRTWRCTYLITGIGISQRGETSPRGRLTGAATYRQEVNKRKGAATVGVRCLTRAASDLISLLSFECGAGLLFPLDDC